MPIPLSQSLLTSVLTALLLATASVEALAAGEEAQAEAISRCFALRRSEPEAAVVLAKSILASPQLQVQPQIKALSCQGMAAGIAGDVAGALESAALIESKVAQHPELPAEFTLRALSNAGSIYHGAGRVHQAEVLYTRVSEIAKHVSAKDAAITRTVMLTNIGLIYADYLDSPEVADGYYLQALAVAKTIGHEELSLLYNHAANLARMGRRDPALAALGEAEALAVRQDNVLFQQRIRAERAGLLIDSGDTAQARTLLEGALVVQRRLPDPAGESDSLSKLSRLQRTVGEKQAALQSADAAWNKVENGQFAQEQIQALRARTAAQAALGQTSAALASADQLHKLQMAALKEQRFEILADLQARMQDAAQRLEVERLRHESEIQSLNLAKAHLLRNSTFLILAVLLLAAILFMLMQRRRNRLLSEISSTDALTGLTNRRTATRQLNAISGSAVETTQGTRHVLFVIDIDHFKKVNDSYGHYAGDGVLVQISRALLAASRPGDIVARWGGEEFLVLCQDLTQDRACAVAKRFCEAMTHTAELAPGQLQTLTVSLGFAPFPFFSDTRTHGDAASWGYSIRMADRALYAAKDRRNAWAGFWGGRGPAHGTAAEVLDEPEKAVRSGDIDIVASYPMAKR
ncbi:MAG: GGDEF domain-containing protein [Pseudoxanthomonas sp.]